MEQEEQLAVFDGGADGDHLGALGAGTMLESEGLLLAGDPDNCAICGEPLVASRMLRCLHSFCEQCLDKKLVGEGGDATNETIIVCPTCETETKVAEKKLSCLPLDVTKTNISDVSNSSVLHCTSCTAKEVAKSRCNTCHNLLCNHCDSAHHYMRCFESHKVVPLEEMRKDGQKITVHKPLECDLHPAENLAYYCNTCAATACCLCHKNEHSEHHTEGILDSELRVRQEMKSLLAENETKSDGLAQLSTKLNNSLEELENERSTAKDLINESYQSYKAVLEKCREEALTKLNELYHERELRIMREQDQVGKALGNLEDARTYTNRLLEMSTVPELMYLRKFVSDRLVELNANIPKFDDTFTIEFRSDFALLESLLVDNFGEFRTEKQQQQRNTLNNNNASSTNQLTPVVCNLANGCASSITNNSSPMSLSTSMQSSFDGDLSGNMNMGNFALTQSPPLAQPASGGANGGGGAGIAGFSSMAEYNLAQLATLAESTNNAATSPTPPFNLADLLTSDTAYKNLASLAKLGLGNESGLTNGALLAAGGGRHRSTSPSPLNHSHPPPSHHHLLNGFTGGAGNAGNGRANSIGCHSSTTTSPLLSTPDDLIINDPLSNLIPAAAAAAVVAAQQQQVAAQQSAQAQTNGLQQQQHNGAGGSIVAAAAAAAAGAGGGVRSNKVSPMQIRSKFGQLGPNKGQFNSPHGFCLGTEEDIIVADTNNHRIQVFDKTGSFKFQFGTSGKDEGQLWYPRKVAVMRPAGKYVVCDRGNERSRMQIFTKNGHFLKKIAIRYIDIVAGLAVTGNGEIVAVDSVSPTVFIISEAGELVRWFDCSDFMREPSDIAIHGKEFYVCDFKGHNVVVFSEEGHFLRRIGCENVTNFPNGIDISDAGDILIGDSHGNRFHVAVFSRDGCLISEFECPYVKVSRCCGLKITSEGYVVTLAKNNHHVLVLNTLYIL